MQHIWLESGIKYKNFFIVLKQKQLLHPFLIYIILNELSSMNVSNVFAVFKEA